MFIPVCVGQVRVKEITYETSHLPPLKYHLIRAYVISQELLLATNQSTQDIQH